MIEALKQRIKRGTKIGEVLYPTAVGPHRSAYPQLDTKRMPVQPPALMPGGHIRQVMGRLDGEDFEYFHGAMMESEGASVAF